MGEKPPKRDGWIKITDRKAAIQKLYDVSDKFERQKEEYHRQEWRRNMLLTTSERCSDCESEDKFEENFCPCCGKRLVEEEPPAKEPEILTEDELDACLKSGEVMMTDEGPVRVDYVDDLVVYGREVQVGE